MEDLHLLVMLEFFQKFVVVRFVVVGCLGFAAVGMGVSCIDPWSVAEGMEAM